MTAPYNTLIEKTDKETLQIIEDEFKTLNSTAPFKKKNVGDRILINIEFEKQEELILFQDNIIKRGIRVKTNL